MVFVHYLTTVTVCWTLRKTWGGHRSLWVSKNCLFIKNIIECFCKNPVWEILFCRFFSLCSPPVFPHPPIFFLFLRERECALWAYRAPINSQAPVKGRLTLLPMLALNSQAPAVLLLLVVSGLNCRHTSPSLVAKRFLVKRDASAAEDCWSVEEAEKPVEDKVTEFDPSKWSLLHLREVEPVL